MRWLIDEMLPPATATELGRLGHDAVTVVGIDLAGAADEVVDVSAVDAGRTRRGRRTRAWCASG